MQMNKIIAAVAVVALLLGGVNLFKSDKVVPIGAVSPYLPTTELNLGGLRLVGVGGRSLTQGTSTVCAISSPSSTSTLVTAGVRFSLASTSAVTVDFANSPTPYSTSTAGAFRINAATYSVGASLPAEIVASTTGSVAGQATVFGPNRYFIVKFYDVNNGVGNAAQGTCHATFAVL